ncbi:uncharacterized protein LOC143894077 [Temnothorax americanus]|uniref:uncharacterized protein LOC143894077 n=1 Tax=Temnothorax americanus TaxID=1964332 RepID=UPI0040680513
MSTNNEEELRTKFWDKLEAEVGAFIPLHIRNICKYNGLDNPLSIRFIDESTIGDIEEFVRNTMTKLLENVEDKENYFGVQHKQAENFKFNHGDKFLLISLAKHVRSKPLDYYGAKCQSKEQSTEEKKRLEFCANEEIRKLKKPSTSNKKPKRDQDELGGETLSEKTFRRMMGMEVSIEVRKKTNRKKDRKGEISEDVLEATIECPVCSTALFCTKKFDMISRWSLSNYHRHIKAHAEKEDDESSLQKSKTVSNPKTPNLVEQSTAEDSRKNLPELEISHDQRSSAPAGHITNITKDLSTEVSENMVPTTSIGQAVYAILKNNSGEY